MNSVQSDEILDDFQLLVLWLCWSWLVWKEKRKKITYWCQEINPGKIVKFGGWLT